jgi:hypothetical protein
MNKIGQLREDVDRLLGSLDEDVFLSLARSDEGLVLEANRAGLVRLASIALRLATDPAPGSHLHLDAASELDEADSSLVLGFRQAPWA